MQKGKNDHSYVHHLTAGKAETTSPSVYGLGDRASVPFPRALSNAHGARNTSYPSVGLGLLSSQASRKFFVSSAKCFP